MTNFTQSPDNQIIIYQTEDGQVKIDVRFEKEMAWILQNQQCFLQQIQRKEYMINKGIMRQSIYGHFVLYEEK